MLSKPDAAPAIDATIARYLVEKQMIHGAVDQQYKNVVPLELFGEVFLRCHGLLPAIGAKDFPLALQHQLLIIQNESIARRV